MPLADTVKGLLPRDDQTKLPLIVVHSHTHLDHRAGDPQFQGSANVHLVPAELAEVRAYFGLSHWPEGMSQLDLGGRVLDVLPAPGHNPAHLVYYDRATGLLFSGDFLMAARLLVDDIDAYRASARRIADFVRERPVSYVLGGHIEEDRNGRLYGWQASHHPDEHALQLGKTEVLALPAALDGFNGFQSARGGFVIINSMHELEAMAAAATLVLAALGYGIYRLVRYRRRERAGRLL
jgi:glyoxylase-like metal-dependent hydrolase (beta-lactamase superfamily II)